MTSLSLLVGRTVVGLEFFIFGLEFISPFLEATLFLEVFMRQIRYVIGRTSGAYLTLVLYDVLVTVKAAPHEGVKRTGLP